ncbi:unnamed protein product [Cladocopium goreaui]|uniref:E3 ubiquitin-protein ligase HERC2 n=1 Tax=Cladocopium goreaui TaxID=2562237 RepID=A0A9P1BST5_9DINO|nr:unnamed protein product [Cladocopium goreaui]
MAHSNPFFKTLFEVASSKMCKETQIQLRGTLVEHGGTLDNLAAALPLDSSIGTYGTHTCQLQNSLTMHLDISRPVASRYRIQLGCQVFSILACELSSAQ